MGICTEDKGVTVDKAVAKGPELTHDFGTHFCSDARDCLLVTDNQVFPNITECQARHCPELLIKIRKSMLESYSFCPMQFYWQYVAKGQPGAPQQKVVQHMVVGTRFHDFAQRFFDYYTMVDDPTATPTDRLALWELTIPEEFNEAEYEMASWWLGYQLQRLIDLSAHGRADEWVPIAREQQMDNPTHGLTSTVDVVEWLDKDINPDTGEEDWTVGKATRQVCIVEYKTGRKMSIESAIRQCTFYALLWQMNGNIGRVTHVKLVNPRLCAFSVYKITRTDIENAIKSVLRLRDIMAKGVYRQVCSEGKYASCHMCNLETLKIFPTGMWKDGKHFADYECGDIENPVEDAPLATPDDELFKETL